MNYAFRGNAGRRGGRFSLDSNRAGARSARMYQSTCFDAGYTEPNNHLFSYESQERVVARFDTHAGSQD